MRTVLEITENSALISSAQFVVKTWERVSQSYVYYYAPSLQTAIDRALAIYSQEQTKEHRP